MIAGKTASSFNCEHQSVSPTTHSPRPRSCYPVICVEEARPGPHSCRPTNSKLSFCFVFLLATSALVSLEVLFHVGYTTSYSPVVYEDSRDMLLHQKFSAVEGSRVRFPRTKRRLPQCIIIGVRKCGTRALLEFLNLHPMIQKATEEVHFFDEDGKYSRGLDWYRRKMPYSFPEQITIEKSPAYFITPSAPDRIYKMNPSIKLLLIVRDPVTRLISDYAQLASNKARKDRTLAAFEDLVLRRDGSVNLGYKPVRISMYSMFFHRWLNTFGRGRIHVVDGDRLVTDPFAEVQKIEKYLGLAHKIQRNNFYYNETKGFFCVRNATAEKCLNESKGRKHPHVSPEVISVLRKFYEPYNQRFYKQTGINFTWPSC